jgi:hypothetical protein
MTLARVISVENNFLYRVEIIPDYSGAQAQIDDLELKNAALKTEITALNDAIPVFEEAVSNAAEVSAQAIQDYHDAVLGGDKTTIADAELVLTEISRILLEVKIVRDNAVRRLAELEGQSASQRLQIKKLIEKIDINTLYPQTAYVRQIFWADFQVYNIGRQVRIIEIPGAEDAAYIYNRPLNEGNVVPTWAMTPYAWLHAELLHSAWHKWLPGYRVGTITAAYGKSVRGYVDSPQNNYWDRVYDVSVPQIYDRNGLPCVAEGIAKRCAVNYMSDSGGFGIDASTTYPPKPQDRDSFLQCPFRVGDRVVIRYVNRDLEHPQIIGYADNPQPLRRLVYARLETVIGDNRIRIRPRWEGENTPLLDFITDYTITDYNNLFIQNTTKNVSAWPFINTLMASEDYTLGFVGAVFRFKDGYDGGFHLIPRLFRHPNFDKKNHLVVCDLTVDNLNFLTDETAWAYLRGVSESYGAPLTLWRGATSWADAAPVCTDDPDFEIRYPGIPRPPPCGGEDMNWFFDRFIISAEVYSIDIGLNDVI